MNKTLAAQGVGEGAKLMLLATAGSTSTPLLTKVSVGGVA